MLKKIQYTYRQYPKQFWLIFFGMFIALFTGTMIWPLLLIYVSKRLSLPLAQIASLFTINAVVSITLTFISGALVDKFGRKWLIISGLTINAAAYLFMIWADTYAYFAVLMTISGLASPLFSVGSDAMLTDIIPKAQRLDAFALTRISKNIGVSMGPAIGGILAGISYNISFISAACGMLIFALLMLLFAKETLPRHEKKPAANLPAQKNGYKTLLADKDFIIMVSLYSFGWITAAFMWVLLPVYANQEYNIPERIYGLIPATNGLMVIFLQVLITRYTKRFRPLSMITLGMFLYALGTGTVAFAGNFWGFMLSIIIVTIGELIIVPTSSAYVANRAHPEMRGRYMGIYNLSWSFARGMGPLIGGWLSDSFGAVSIWYGGFLIGTLASLGLLLLTVRVRHREIAAV